MGFLFAAWCLAGAAFSQTPGGFPAWTPPVEVVAAVRAAAERPLAERLEAATRPLLGRPYINEVAGEGAGVDPDAPARYDAFDCMSFLEEALGLVMAADPVGAPQIRDAFRYHGPATYSDRNHFMEAQWIPNAIRSGLVTDVTRFVGRARTLTKEVTPDVWRTWGRRRFFLLPDVLLPVGSWTLDYLDLAEAEAAAPRIPPGAIVVTLRVDRAWKPIVTTHISLVLAGVHEPVMRHASKMGDRIVRDDRLSWYMVHLRDYVNWPALGVTILMPREQGPTVAATLTPDLPREAFPPAEGDLPHFDPKPLTPGVSGEDLRE